MTRLTIKEILAGRAGVGEPLTVEGWVRTRRDSKAGFSFLQRNQVASWGPVNIGDSLSWLPVATQFVWRYPLGRLSRVDAVYTNHRRFDVSTNLTFQQEPSKNLVPNDRQ